MGMRGLEAAILRELREVTGNRKLRQKDIQEWTTGDIKPVEGEMVVYLPTLHINVAYKVAS